MYIKQQPQQVLQLFKSGFTVNEIHIDTGIPKKTILRWLNSWKRHDKPKKDTIFKLRKRLHDYALDCFTTTQELCDLANTILKLESELIIKIDLYYAV